MPLPAPETGLDRDSVANVTLLVALDKAQLDERVRKLVRRRWNGCLLGIDVVLGRYSMTAERSEGFTHKFLSAWSV